MTSRTCTDPGIFFRVGWGGGGGGGPGQSDKKKALTRLLFFIYFFLVLSLFYRSQIKWSISKLSFYKVPEGRGSNFFQGVSTCLFPKETHITCDYPGGGGGCPDLLSPLWIRTCRSMPPDCRAFIRGVGGRSLFIVLTHLI